MVARIGAVTVATSSAAEYIFSAEAGSPPNRPPEFHRVRVRAWWNGAGLVLPVSSTRWLPRYGSIRTMQNRSESHGKYVARWKNGEVNSGFDARLVLEEQQAGDL